MSDKLAINVKGKMFYIDLNTFDIYTQGNSLKDKKTIWFSENLNCYVCIINSKLIKIPSLTPRHIIKEYLKLLDL